jgi:hypothetical protein
LPFSPSLAPLRHVARRPSMARPPAAFPPSVSPLFLPLSLFKVEPELSLPSLHSHHAFTHSTTIYAQRHRPVSAAAGGARRR